MRYEAPLAFLGLVVVAAGFWLESRGRKAERLDEAERQLEDIRRAGAARDRLRRDSDVLARLRARFTR